MTRRLWSVPAVLVALLAVPSQAQGQAQLRSNVASIALTAYAAPGVHLAAPATSQPQVNAAAFDLTRMTVNTAYRIELHGTASRPVVLLRQSGAGQVPWDRIRALLDTADTGSRVLDLVVTPQL